MCGLPSESANSLLDVSAPCQDDRRDSDRLRANVDSGARGNVLPFEDWLRMAVACNGRAACTTTPSSELRHDHHDAVRNDWRRRSSGIRPARNELALCCFCGGPPNSKRVELQATLLLDLASDSYPDVPRRRPDPMFRCST